MIEIFIGLQLILQIILIACVFYLIKYLIWNLPCRILRTINISKHGWPPDHLDADGDWKPEQDNDD